jgi:hypothetical protein
VQGATSIHLRRHLLALVTGLALPLAAGAQPGSPLLESYGRVVALHDYVTGHVGELLIVCAAQKVLTEADAEARYQAWRKRNAALLERAERWQQAAEKRLQAQGEARAAQQRGREASANATALASVRANGVIGKAKDPREACAVRLAAIESGQYDLSRNDELVALLKANP